MQIDHLSVFFVLFGVQSPVGETWDFKGNWKARRNFCFLNSPASNFTLIELLCAYRRTG
jgi:hypothetical protein